MFIEIQDEILGVGAVEFFFEIRGKQLV